MRFAVAMLLVLLAACVIVRQVAALAALGARVSALERYR